ncbi:hypothetical protein KL939_005391 [Ogataea angusta]|nr:hypothetical protein KL939_005391 [Ogataea angusta]
MSTASSIWRRSTSTGAVADQHSLAKCGVARRPLVCRCSWTRWPFCAGATRVTGSSDTDSTLRPSWSGGAPSGAVVCGISPRAGTNDSVSVFASASEHQTRQSTSWIYFIFDNETHLAPVFLFMKRIWTPYVDIMTLGISQSTETREEATLKKSPSITNISKFAQPKPLPLSFNMKISEELAEIRTALTDLKARSKNNNQSLAKLNENLATFNETTGGTERKELQTLVEQLREIVEELRATKGPGEGETDREASGLAENQIVADQSYVEALRAEQTELLQKNKAATEELLRTELAASQLRAKCAQYAAHLKTLRSEFQQLEAEKEHLISNLEHEKQNSHAPSGQKLLDLLSAASLDSDETSRAGPRAENKENHRIFSSVY